MLRARGCAKPPALEPTVTLIHHQFCQNFLPFDSTADRVKKRRRISAGNVCECGQVCSALANHQLIQPQRSIPRTLPLARLAGFLRQKSDDSTSGPSSSVQKAHPQYKGRQVCAHTGSVSHILFPVRSPPVWMTKNDTMRRWTLHAAAKCAPKVKRPS